MRCQRVIPVKLALVSWLGLYRILLVGSTSYLDVFLEPIPISLYNGHMSSNSRTIRYYDENSVEYSKTVNVADMDRTYERVLKYVPAGGSIVDVGCGSGGDLKHFYEAGYAASGIDASEGMCKVAHEYSGCPVECCDALSWKPDEKVDAIWANASLLHLKYEDIITFLKTKSEYLNPKGILYFSMKAGIPEGYDEQGRYFTPYSESILDSVLAEGKLKVVERWTETDSLARKGFYWEAIILGRDTAKTGE